MACVGVRDGDAAFFCCNFTTLTMLCIASAVGEIGGEYHGVSRSIKLGNGDGVCSMITTIGPPFWTYILYCGSLETYKELTTGDAVRTVGLAVNVLGHALIGKLITFLILLLHLIMVFTFVGGAVDARLAVAAAVRLRTDKVSAQRTAVRAAAAVQLCRSFVRIS